MNTSKRETRRATYQDVIDAPAHRVAEIVDGRLYVSPRPPPLAALAKTGLNVVLGRPFDRGRDDGPGGWWLLRESELHFGDDVVVPDFTGWRRERMPETPTTAFVTLAPDWVCETLSPETRELDSKFNSGAGDTLQCPVSPFDVPSGTSAPEDWPYRVVPEESGRGAAGGCVADQPVSA